MHSPTIILLVGSCADDQHAQHGAIAGAEPGWQVEFCDSGRGALARVGQLQPRCIVLDDRLPDMTGLECFRALRTDPASTMPVLMLASCEDQSGTAEALRAGVQDYLFKDARGNYLALLPAVLKKTLREHRIDQEKKAGQAALATLSHRYERLFQDVSDGIILADEARVIESVNPAACGMFGYPAIELCGRPLDLLLQPDHQFEYGLECAAREVRGMRRNGASFPIEMSITDVGFKGRRMFACVLRNATQRRAVQDVLPETSAPHRKAHHEDDHDALTGLSNRSEFERAAARCLQAAKRLHQSHALLRLDLHRLKEVKDRCGHPAGDQLLRQLANLLQSRMRKSDTLGRLGDNAFGILLGDCPAGRAQDIAQQLIDAVRGFRFEWEDNRLNVGVSVGMVAITDRTPDLRAMLDAADAACCIAGDKGGSCVHVFDQSGADLISCLR